MINQAAAELLADVRLDDKTHPRDWLHNTGRRLTDDEVALIMSAGIAELEEAQRIAEFRAIASQTRASMAQQIADIAGRYFAKYPDKRTAAEIIPLMTTEHRSEFVELAKALEATQ